MRKLFMQTKNLLFIITLITNFYQPLTADTWKILCYMDSSDALSDMAIKNMTDMMRGKPNDTVDLIVQLHAYFDAGLRYHVTENGLKFLEEVALSGDSKQDFIDAATWAFTDHNADHTMLIIANHGYGILDPQWNDQSKEWEVEAGKLNNQCSLKRSHLNDLVEQHKRHRGFMFSSTPRVYLNNPDFIDGLATIKNNILHNKPIDVLAFDTCMGDMFEIAYLVAPYANYLVGSQSCSLIDGFDYQNIIPILNQGLSPREVSMHMVKVFDAYYRKNDASGVYTHAALDLSHVYNVSNALDNLINQILNMPELKPLLVQALKASPRFCLWPMYTDLIAFFRCLENELVSMNQSNELSSLQAALHNFYTTIPSLIIARCGGHTTENRAYGIAIYLPRTTIDSSYYSTEFSQKSEWIKLLELICN